VLLPRSGQDATDAAGSPETLVHFTYQITWRQSQKAKIVPHGVNPWR